MTSIFFHKNIIGYTGRPHTSVEEMDAALLKNWNDTVSSGDTVYFLGDLAFFKKIEMYRELLEKLNGDIIWIKGNHDPGVPKLIQAKLPHVIWVGLNTILDFQGRKFFLTHRPMEASKFIPTICGHVHQKWKMLASGTTVKEFKSNQSIVLNHPCINVSVDVWNFTPVRIETIIALIDNGMYDERKEITE